MPRRMIRGASFKPQAIFDLLRQTDIFWGNFSKHEFLRSVGAQALRGVPLIEHEGRRARERQRERSGNLIINKYPLAELI